MTRERALELANDALRNEVRGPVDASLCDGVLSEPLLPPSLHADAVTDAILAAVSQEREACARIVEELDVWEFPSVSRALASAASTIRERRA